MRLIPLSQVRPYPAPALPPKHDFGRRFELRRSRRGAFRSPSFCAVAHAERRGSLPGIGAADDVPVARGLMVCGEAEYRFE